MIELPELLPWQSDPWKLIQSSFERFPHATLLTGVEGIGKFQFGSRVAAALLCDSKEDQPCGICRGCRLFSSSTHPDLHVITSEAKALNISPQMKDYADRYLEDSKSRAKRKTVRTTITINQTRSIIDAASKHSTISENKVFIIAPVVGLTISASNSLLKVLEEPGDNSFFILITDSVQNILPTIVSRCQKFPLAEPGPEDSTKWLKQTGFTRSDIESVLASRKGPLLGKMQLQEKRYENTERFSLLFLKQLEEGREDISALVDLAVKIGAEYSLHQIHQLTSDMIKIKSSLNLKFQSKHTKQLKTVAAGFTVRSLFEIYDHIGRINFELKDGSLDKTLALEDVILLFRTTIQLRV